MNQFLSLEFFPADTPVPACEKKRHEGRIETTFDSGHTKSRPEPTRTFNYFEYSWQALSKAGFSRIETFCKSIVNQPIAGWRHPGAEGEWIVALLDFDNQSSSVSTRGNVIISESYALIVRMKILREGSLEAVK